jgi:sugar-specific transcriptional regulator TrmB
MWKTQEMIKSPATLKTQISTSVNIHPEEIRKKLVADLIDDIYKNNEKYITFTSTKQMQYNFEEIYTAEISLVPKNFGNVIINDSDYTIDDVSFSHEQIEKAVIKTYPEYFI